MLYHYLVIEGDDVAYYVYSYQIKDKFSNKLFLEIPEDATFATRHRADQTIYFRKEGYWHNGENWVHSGYTKKDFEKDEMIWECTIKPFFVKEESIKGVKIKELPAYVVNPEVLDIHWKVEYFKKWLEGKPIQYKVGGTHWHNMTENSLSYFAHNNVQLRDKPREIEIDGKLFPPEQAINYLKNNYL